MDDIDRRICALLCADARQSLAQIGAQVGLAASSVNDRLRRLIATGAIRRMRADVDPVAVGLPVAAFVWLLLAPGTEEARFRDEIARMPEVTACHHVTGAWSYLIQIRVPSLQGVEAFLSALKAAGWVGRSETMLSLSAVVEPPFRFRGTECCS